MGRQYNCRTGLRPAKALQSTRSSDPKNLELRSGSPSPYALQNTITTMSQDHISTSASPTHSLKKRSRPLGDCTRRRTRTKLSPPSNSSASDQSVSDNSALIPTITSHRSTEASDVDTDASDSSELSESSEEPSSESSSSSEDDSDEGSELEDEEAEMGVVNLRANRGKKPSMKLRKNELDELGPDIRPWLKDFLPQLKAANDELEADRRAGKLTDKEIETDAEGKEQYIEMVSLCVLGDAFEDADCGSGSRAGCA